MPDLADLRPLLPRLRPAAATEYLERRGWIRRDLERDDLVEYLSPVSDDRPEPFPVLLPQHRDLFDYSSMMLRALTIIAEIEERSALDTAMQMLSLIDVFKTRVPSLGIDDGSITINQAIELTENTRDLLTFAASSEIRQVPYFGRRLKEAVELAQNCRFGQTEVGSFVATFYLPLPPRHQRPLFEDDDLRDPAPLERRTISRVMRGLRVVEEAAYLQDARVIVDAYQTAFNGNMCEALAGMIGSIGGDAISFSVAYDPAWRIPEAPTSIVIPRRAYGVVEEAARELRGTPPVHDVTVTGYVYQLHHEGPLGGGADHQIRLLWDAEEGTYKIRVQLSPDEYAKAIEAHGQQRQVRVAGQLEKVGRYWMLAEPHGFEVLGE